MDWGEKRTPPPHPLKVSAGKLLGACRKNRKGKARDLEKSQGFYHEKNVDLPSGYVKHCYWKWPFIVDFSHWKWWFSIVMLVCQRVIDKHLIVEIREKNVAKQMWFENVWKNRMARPMIVGKMPRNKRQFTFFLELSEHRGFLKIEVPKKTTKCVNGHNLQARIFWQTHLCFAELSSLRTTVDGNPDLECFWNQRFQEGLANVRIQTSPKQTVDDGCLKWQKILNFCCGWVMKQTAKKPPWAGTVVTSQVRYHVTLWSDPHRYI